MSRKRKFMLAACLVVLIPLGIVAAQCAFLPTGWYYRRLINGADRIELGVSSVTRWPQVTNAAVIIDPHEKSALAESLALEGPWLPGLEVAAYYTCRVRTVRGPQVQDIVIRGDSNIKHGRWIISVSPSLMRTFETLVARHGSHVPSPEELDCLLKGQ